MYGPVTQNDLFIDVPVFLQIFFFFAGDSLIFLDHLGYSMIFLKTVIRYHT